MLAYEQKRQEQYNPESKSSEMKEPNNELGVESKKEKEKDTDTIGKIRNEDLNSRICTRDPKQREFDILLSGTSATLVIQTNKKLHFGWIGDSNIALQTLKDKQVNGANKTMYLNDPAHKPSVLNEKIRIYNNRGEIRETSDGF